MAPAPALATGVGASAREQRAAALDAWLASALPPVPGAVLVAVGGFGRRECAPYGDLDLVFIHNGLSDVDEQASRLWYPIWDAGFALDHSVRTPDEALAVARTDVKAALGLLDGRPVAGDRELARRLHQASVAQWRREARTALPALRELTEARWEAFGQLAFLLEADLKEARGGLRDVGVLRGLGYSGLSDATRPAVRAAHRQLLDARDALHMVRRRRGDRLVAQDRQEVAELLDLPDGDALLRRIAEAGRTIAHASDDGWRAVQRWLNRGNGSSGRRPLARDVVESDGEAVLARTAISARPDPSLALRVAAAAARAGRPIARPTMEWLAAHAPAMPSPWPASARHALFGLLGAGPGLVPVWEACDRYGLVTAWLPEFARVRSLPQHSPVHRFTVDRHLVETAAAAGQYARDVSRPDLLVLCGLLHDIGKGLPGDHSTVGEAIAAAIARRIGLPPDDVATVEKVVRLHLLLPETATRRDLADPVTVQGAADAIGDQVTLELLHALARADATATGPAAWSAWKGRLVADLVDRVAATFAAGAVQTVESPVLIEPSGPLPDVQVSEERVSVTARDHRGLIAAVAGCLSLYRLDVVTADAVTVGGLTQVTCGVEPRFGGTADLGSLATDLRRVAVEEFSPPSRLTAPARASGPAPRLVWQPATAAAVLEVRAGDSPGLLYRLARALADTGARIRAARISTLGAEAVDAFYLEGGWDDPTDRAAVEKAVLGAAGWSA